MGADGGEAEGWRVAEWRAGFNAKVFGAIRVLAEPDGRARCRIETSDEHANPQGALHGGFLLAFADIVCFLGPRTTGRLTAEAVTVTIGATFIAPGAPGRPIDALVEIAGETGRLIFTRGTFEQDGRGIGTFEATLRKRSAQPAVV